MSVISVFQNAFMEKLGPDFSLPRMLVVDFLHEFELGVWKVLLVHLIRILDAAAPGRRLVARLDERYDLSCVTICCLVLRVDNIDFTSHPSSRKYVDLPIMFPK
jgi:hypothetical protein